MTKHFFYVSSDLKLAPDDEVGLERLQRIGVGGAVEVEVKQPRNIKHHRKFWKMMDLVRRQSVLEDTYHTTKALVNAFKLEIGVAEAVIRPSGAIVMIPGSIAFTNMEQGEFDAFYNNAIKIIVREFLGGGPEDEQGLRNEIEEIIR